MHANVQCCVPLQRSKVHHQRGTDEKRLEFLGCLFLSGVRPSAKTTFTTATTSSKAPKKETKQRRFRWSENVRLSLWPLRPGDVPKEPGAKETGFCAARSARGYTTRPLSASPGRGTSTLIKEGENLVAGIKPLAQDVR